MILESWRYCCSCIFTRTAVLHCNLNLFCAKQRKIATNTNTSELKEMCTYAWNSAGKKEWREIMLSVTTCNIHFYEKRACLESFFYCKFTYIFNNPCFCVFFTTKNCGYERYVTNWNITHSALCENMFQTFFNYFIRQI